MASWSIIQDLTIMRFTKIICHRYGTAAFQKTRMQTNTTIYPTLGCSFVAMSSTMYASILPYLLAPPAPATTKPYVKTRVSVTPPSRGRQVTHLPIFPQAAIHSGNKPIPKSIIITIATVRMHPLQAPVFVLFQMIAWLMEMKTVALRIS